MKFFIFLAVVVVIVFFVIKSNKKQKAEAGVVLDQSAANGLPFPCVIEGTIDMSPLEDRKKALAIEAVGKGITITGDYDKDVAAQGGEMTLVGAFKFTLDANGQQVPAASFINLFGVEYPVSGGMRPDGVLGMTGEIGGARVGIEGYVKGGIYHHGKVVKGWLPHIYGVLNGVYTPGQR